MLIVRMAEEKLHEKRLKERARRNGMAHSIDEMRLIVPELMDAKKTYSQAKVVAIALDHIYELQRENAEYRQRLGLKPREQDAKVQRSKARSPKTPKPAAERGRKRMRAEEAPSERVVVPRLAPPPSSAPVHLAVVPFSTPSEELDVDELVFGSDSVSVSDTPLTLSPRHDMFAAPFDWDDMTRADDLVALLNSH